MVYRPLTDNKLCFVLMPFGNPFNGYYQHIIKPAVAVTGLLALRSDEVYGTRPIIQDIWESIWKARIIVADVTTKNPNVNYELGLCHALGVPTILISKQIEDVPFDYRHRRCILYDTNDAGWEHRLSDDLKRTIEKTLDNRDSPSDLTWPYETHRGKAQTSPVVIREPRQVTIQTIIEDIASLDLKEASDLVTLMEERFGVIPTTKKTG